MKSANQKKSLWTTLFILLTVFSLLVSCVGCSHLSFLEDQDGTGNPPDTDRGDSLPAITPPDPSPIIYYNPLTGLACDEALLSCRPISVCIGNFDGKRQEGLSFADILIEAPVEGDKTRLWAICSDNTKAGTISSVASVRDYMMPAALAFGTVNAYAGTTDTVGAPATPHNGDNLDYLYHNLTETFRKDADGALSTDMSTLYRSAKAMGLSLERKDTPLPFRLAELNAPYTPTSNTIRSISYRYSMANTVSFAYDTETGLYYRDQGGTAHVDAQTGERLAFANLLLLFHNVSYYHTANETTFSLDTQNGGDGYFYTGGGMLPIHWRYLSDGSLSVTDDEGNEITANRGKTYIGMLRVTDSTSLIAK